MENAKKWTAKRIVNTVISVILWIFLAFAALTTVIALATTANSNKVPNLFGYSMMNVLTDSMDCEDGVMKEGDLILVRLLDDEEKNDLAEGDVISFLDSTLRDENGKKQVTTHRIVSIERDTDGKLLSVKTKGDNPNAGIDTIDRYQNEILGKFHKNLGAVGEAFGFLQSSKGFLLCVVVPLLVFFIYEVFVVVKNVVELKNKDKKVITEEDEELIKQQAIAEFLRQQEEKAKEKGTEPTETPETPAQSPEPDEKGE